jgi:hypothetical protein
MDLDRETAVRGRDEDPAADPERLRYEPALLLSAADMLDHRVREHDVELAVGERERACVSLHVADARIAGTEALTVLEPEGGDALGPRVVLLEEVERAASLLLAEAELVCADVEDRRLGRRLELVEEQLQLAPPRPERDRVDEPHAWKYPVRGGQ